MSSVRFHRAWRHPGSKHPELAARLLIALAAGNYLFGLKMFVPFDKQVMVGCAVVATLVMRFFAPTLAEMDGQIDAKIAR